MESYLNLFQVRFLKARKIANLSLRELAQRVGVSHTLLNRYEKGEAMPSSSLLIKIANTLNVSVDFFFREEKIDLKEIHFRKKSSLTQKDFVSIEERAKDFYLKYLKIEGIGAHDKNSFSQKKSIANKSPEEWAKELREDWNLGDDPIPNLQQLLENKGIYIFEINVDNDKFDAFSAYVDHRAFLVVSSKLNNNLPRKRFTLAHELGHLFVKQNSDIEEKEHEKFANRFASAFLMPRNTFSKMFGWERSRMSLSDFYPIKGYFGTSIAAIVRRARDLGLVNESFYKRFNVVYKKNGWHKNEPGEYRGEESSSRYVRLVMKAVQENEISLSKGAEMLGKSVNVLKGELENGAVA